MATAPMTQTHQVDPGARLQRVPVGIFLPPPQKVRARTARRLADWHGLHARDVARLIATYTRRGDLVLDLDAHPTITRAARYLRRHPATLVTHRERPRLRFHTMRDLPPRLRRSTHRAGAGLLVTTLPRPHVDVDLHGLTEAMRSWRSLLRPGGFLLTALADHNPRDGLASHRSTVVAAARAAGLLYHQHLLVVRVPLPEIEPRAQAHTDAKLLGGRHVRAHVDLLTFAATATSSEAADVRH